MSSGKAAGSPGLAVLSWGVWPFVDLLALGVGISSLILAVLGLRDVRRSQGQLKGDWLAHAGIAVECVAMLVFLLLLPAVTRVREAVDRMNAA
jgi:hypothetical protein